MRIRWVEIANFRALEEMAVPLQQFSVLIGENDVGKTSFLYALEKFFLGKKLSDPKDWYKHDVSKPIRVIVTFSDVPEAQELQPFVRSDGTIVISKVFAHDKAPDVNAVLEDKSPAKIDKKVLDAWFSQDHFHFIPVRRDLGVQFSMNKTALLGKLMRAKIKQAIGEAGAGDSLAKLTDVLRVAIDGPRESMEAFLRQQLSNDSVKLGFDELEIDPSEGVKFAVTLSDDRVDSIHIQDRGAGTQNNLIIALFRLVARSDVEGNFIFAMEEPENSLHPKAQRQLLSVIQEISTGNQVIVTTHSPVFIDRSQFESNIWLTRTLSGNTVAKVFNADQLAEIRTDLGIRASDALLKGGGNCAVLIEGNTEEDGFPIFMEMMGLSEFELGIALVNMGGSDFDRARNIVQLLRSYDIPCVVVLDRDAQKTADDLERMQGKALNNLKKVFVLKKGTIEDYYPEAIVAAVINQEFSPTTPVDEAELHGDWSGKSRLDAYKRVMHDHNAGSSIEYLKSHLGQVGTRMMRDRDEQPDAEIQEILRMVAEVARS